MARPYNETCLVLKKTKLGEADIIVSLLSSEGKQIRAVAKGARKPGNKRFGARVEPFSLVALQLYPGKSLDNITELKLIETHSSCREVFEKTCTAALVAEFLEKFSRDGDVGEKVFELACAFFNKTSAMDANEAPALCAAFFIKAFTLLGFKPALKQCALCGVDVDEAIYFDISCGGVLCANCAPVPSSADSATQQNIISWLNYLLYSTFDEIAKRKNCPVQELMRFVQLWMSEYIGFELKSFSLFDTIL